MTRENLRLYLPLLGFVVPTLAIGYGVVIPRSCIAGVNPLSIGFGTTVLGAAMTYVAGLRLAVPSCSRFTRRQRIERAINRQAAHPRGWFGRLLGLIWRFEHRAINEKTLDLLELAPHHDVLEVGAGAGHALAEAAARAPRGTVTGIDVSELMVEKAQRRNANGLRSGHVLVRQVDGAELGLSAASFDRIFSVHCLYFWPDPELVLSQLLSALRPGGNLVLAFRPNTAVPSRFRDEIYRFYAPAEVAAMLERCGFERIEIIEGEDPSATTLIRASRAGRGSTA
jgi:arsenite methyltransferase